MVPPKRENFDRQKIGTTPHISFRHIIRNPAIDYGRISNIFD
jgi:hypothetical protein